MKLNRRQFAFLCSGSSLIAQAPPVRTPIEWHDARRFRVEGLGFGDLKSPYDRLPARAENIVRPEVWTLSRDSAGVLVRFTAATTAIHARWTLTKPKLAAVVSTAVASSGLDLYARDDGGRWRWLGVGKPDTFPVNSAILANSLPPAAREYMLYLPLHNGVASLEIGAPAGSLIEPAPARPAGAKPIVFYGTSITHGYAASRAGMTHVAILGRRFERPVINLGFSGNGRMELEVTRLVAELDAAVIVLDCLPNMGAKEIHERAEACVRMLREAWPQTPIVLVEDRNYPDGFLIASRRARNQTNHEALRAVYAKLQKDKTPRLSYLEAANLLGGDGEATADGSHPSDLGFMRQAAEFERVLRPLLDK